MCVHVHRRLALALCGSVQRMDRRLDGWMEGWIPTLCLRGRTTGSVKMVQACRSQWDRPRGFPLPGPHQWRLTERYQDHKNNPLPSLPSLLPFLDPNVQ